MIDDTGHSHAVASEEDFCNVVLASEVKVAHQFQIWVLHCVLAAMLLDRFYFVGEERGVPPPA